ncbi:hypothetical protein MNBD_GAMMA21-2167 [hydrothermal vent metagenome]|uniref:Uncharacterized protein n=1 Tax=hydrothermal vent metagenome TaxID=652676 RepID=A0A3B1AUM4_9ZZZZ
MNIHESYFSIKNPLEILDRWLNPYRYSTSSDFRDKRVEVKWTQRANKALSSRTSLLTIEMQIYFSCVVKKRVLFHDESDLDAVTINDKLRIISRAVQSGSCDAVEFAKNFPIKHELTATSAKKMLPSLLCIDYKNQQWVGDFSI